MGRLRIRQTIYRCGLVKVQCSVNIRIAEVFASVLLLRPYEAAVL
jgi:hypothetical protein